MKEMENTPSDEPKPLSKNQQKKILKSQKWAAKKDLIKQQNKEKKKLKKKASSKNSASYSHLNRFNTGPKISSKVVCYFVLGGPGSGKGTMCSNLVRDFGLVHLSAGDLLREERDSGSPDGDLINSIILQGKIVPVKITVNLIKKAMEKNGWNKKEFLIDGFPRNQDNVDGWEEVLSEHVDMRFVLFLECTEEAMISRIQARSIAAGEQKRNDDNIEVLLKRFAVFKEQSMPIVELYQKESKVRTIDATKSADEVYE